MNILISFEDEYGCYSLFKELRASTTTYSKRYALGTKKFKVPSNEVQKYDLTICVFDLDSFSNKSLMLSNKHFLSKTKKLLQHIDKVVFIPVFFCFETLVLFSYQFREIINDTNALTKILLHYTKYYNYSKVIPEVLDDYKNNLNAISKYNQDKNIFYPQMFHQEYLKNLLQIMYPNISAKKLEDKFKNTPALITYLSKLNKLVGLEHLTYDSILDGLLAYADYNREFLNLLLCTNLEDMIQYAGQANYDRIIDLMDTYRIKLEGNERISNSLPKLATSDLNSTSVKKLNIF